MSLFLEYPVNLCQSIILNLFFSNMKTIKRMILVGLSVLLLMYTIIIWRVSDKRKIPSFIKNRWFKKDLVVPLNCKDVEINSSTKYFPKLHRHESKRVTEKHWELSTIQTKVDGVGYLMNPSAMCDGDEIYIAFLTLSAVNSTELRDVLRTTWAGIKSYEGKRLVHMFVVGTHPDHNVMVRVQEENMKYNDIIMFNFTDSYRGLTHKTLSTYRWALQYCTNVKYIVRATDDIFLSYKKLFFHISPLRETRIFFGCGADLRVDLHTWLSGVFILSSIDVVRDMFLLSCKTPHFFPDDVYLGILAEMLGLHSRGRNIIFCGQPMSADYYNYKLPLRYRQDMSREGGYMFLFHMGSSNRTAIRILELWHEMKPVIL